MLRIAKDNYIHELSTNTIIDILTHGAWKTEQQSLTSASTNDNDLPEPTATWLAMGENTAGINAFADVKFESHVKKILDVGGGKFDCNTHYMLRERNITLLVWDPYNRSSSHNTHIQTEVEKSNVEAVTSMSVLNVIPEVTARLAHIATVKAAVTLGGKAYFKIWPGEKPLQGTYLPSATSTFYQANAYADRFFREIETVFGIGNVKLDQKIPNLIIAVKKTAATTSRNDILLTQRRSKNELSLLSQVRDRSLSNLYTRQNIYKLFTINLTLMKKMADNLLLKEKQSNSALQREYDKKCGIVLYQKIAK